MRPLELSLTGRCPDTKGIIVDGCTACMAQPVLARTLVWLWRHQWSAPLRPAPAAAADRRASGGWHCLAIRLADRPASDPARSSGVNESAATVAWTTVPAEITVTVAIVLDQWWS